MSIIYVLIPLAVIIVCIGVAVFFWAVRNNQFDDLERQGYSILFDDDIEQGEQQQNNENLRLSEDKPSRTSHPSDHAGN
ncbi:cbb3-type cytochrome oxidase assembly protein CcoS [Agaribacter flavus]|uniref:Cbb3-type cytochrome oxidase assembly protein CcoS n=1 Tax=Agaribacter flavus TaxID=1902781 RepID=A0ABV7FN37_9ALTE